MVSALAVGAGVVLYDGSPLLPTPTILWDLIDQLGYSSSVWTYVPVYFSFFYTSITILGTSAKWIAVLEDREVKPRETMAVSHLMKGVNCFCRKHP